MSSLNGYAGVGSCATHMSREERELFLWWFIIIIFLQMVEDSLIKQCQGRLLFKPTVILKIRLEAFGDLTDYKAELAWTNLKKSPWNL